MKKYKDTKVTQKAVTSFNSGRSLSGNDNWNKANGLHTREQDQLFRAVQYADSGMMKNPISIKKVKEYQSIFCN